MLYELIFYNPRHPFIRIGLGNKQAHVYFSNIINKNLKKSSLVGWGCISAEG